LSKETENPVTRKITLPLRYEADFLDGADKDLDAPARSATRNEAMAEARKAGALQSTRLIIVVAEAAGKIHVEPCVAIPRSRSRTRPDRNGRNSQFLSFYFLCQGIYPVEVTEPADFASSLGCRRSI
jgi:hypothetical protein